MDWVKFVQISLSILVALLGIGGPWYMFSIDRLREYEWRKKTIRITLGSLMFLSAIGLCVLYKEYIKYWLVTGVNS